MIVKGPGAECQFSFSNGKIRHRTLVATLTEYGSATISLTAVE